jgi:NADPH-dependent glutamate synthase beta subunit-like oxidoreductase
MSSVGAMKDTHVVIIVGAGPAGMSVANKMAEAGHEVVILNRDIKFGGLAEYGIFPSKLKLRGGLKKTYWGILDQPNVHYFGNISVGKGKNLTVEDLGRRRQRAGCLSCERRGVSLQSLAWLRGSAIRDGQTCRRDRSGRCDG